MSNWHKSPSMVQVVLHVYGLFSLSKSIGIRATHDFEQFGNALDLLLSGTHYNNIEQEELQHNVDERIKLDNKTYTSPNDITIKQINFPHSYLIDIMVELSHYH
jgi:hypothetical protein